jgi:hypothetical protein
MFQSRLVQKTKNEYHKYVRKTNENSASFLTSLVICKDSLSEKAKTVETQVLTARICLLISDLAYEAIYCSGFYREH